MPRFSVWSEPTIAIASWLDSRNRIDTGKNGVKKIRDRSFRNSFMCRPGIRLASMSTQRQRMG
jgi:hypothetical protein